MLRIKGILAWLCLQSVLQIDILLSLLAYLLTPPVRSLRG